MHRTASGDLGLEDQYIEYKLEPMPCYYCFTTEGEPELQPNQGASRYNHTFYHFTREQPFCTFTIHRVAAQTIVQYCGSVSPG